MLLSHLLLVQTNQGTNYPGMQQQHSYLVQRGFHHSLYSLYHHLLLGTRENIEICTVFFSLNHTL